MSKSDVPQVSSISKARTLEEILLTCGKLRLLLSLWLREFAVSPRPLKVIMDEISEKARSRGLTPEILESLLNAN